MQKITWARTLGRKTRIVGGAFILDEEGTRKRFHGVIKSFERKDNLICITLEETFCDGTRVSGPADFSANRNDDTPYLENDGTITVNCTHIGTWKITPRPFKTHKK